MEGLIIKILKLSQGLLLDYYTGIVKLFLVMAILLALFMNNDTWNW
jgi:hypothetical protein